MLPLHKQILINFSNSTSGPPDYPVGRYSEAAYLDGVRVHLATVPHSDGKGMAMSSIVQVPIGHYSHD